MRSLVCQCVLIILKESFFVNQCDLTARTTSICFHQRRKITFMMKDVVAFSFSRPRQEILADLKYLKADRSFNIFFTKSRSYYPRRLPRTMVVALIYSHMSNLPSATMSLSCNVLVFPESVEIARFRLIPVGKNFFLNVFLLAGCCCCCKRLMILVYSPWDRGPITPEKYSMYVCIN